VMIHKVKINKKYPFRRMQPGETFKLNDDDIRSAQKMAWCYRTRCKRPIRIVIAKSDDGFHCRDGSTELREGCSSAICPTVSSVLGEGKTDRSASQ